MMEVRLTRSMGQGPVGDTAVQILHNGGQPHAPRYGVAAQHAVQVEGGGANEAAIVPRPLRVAHFHAGVGVHAFPIGGELIRVPTSLRRQIELAIPPALLCDEGLETGGPPKLSGARGPAPFRHAYPGDVPSDPKAKRESR